MQTNHRFLRVAAPVGVLVLMLACGFPAHAVDFKVGFVNVAVVLDQIPQAVEARTRIEHEFEPRDNKLLTEQKLIRELEDRLVKDVAVISASERGRQESEIRQRKRELRRSQDEFREDLNLRRSQELSELQRMVTKVIQTMARKEEYDLIMTDGVIFAGEKIDITKRVIERLRSESKGSGG